MGQALAVALLSAAMAAGDWKPLFDGKTLSNWKPTEFGGEGAVRVRSGTIVLDRGSNMTGITWTGGPLPKTNYEISLEAMRLSGSDFFCGLTFPVGDSHCSFIVGGWGGGVVGLSSIDGRDASENETTQVMDFTDNRWYRVLVRVTPARIQSWIDNEEMVDVAIGGRRIGIRWEVELSRPLGVATWLTSAALRDIKLREIR